MLGTLLPEQFTSYSAMINEYKGNNSLLFIATTILLAPFAEELIFRGLILKFARKSLEKENDKKEADKKEINKKAQMIAIIIQAVLFALYHGNLIQMCYALVFGIMFGIIAVKFNSLIPSTLTHMIVNGTLYIIPNDVFESIPYACAVFAVSTALLIFTYVMFLKSQTKLSSVESHLD
jgi:membrane protease YdiL (CAAX protease family)